MDIANNKHGQPISINEVNDINEIFYCPNCGCEMYVKSVTGEKAKHFCAVNFHTLPNCNDANKYIDLEINHILKSPLEDILKTHHNSSSNKPSKSNSSSERRENLYIHTPNQLYKFCKYNSFNTEYTNNLKVRDIFITDKNLNENNNFEGITGIKLVKVKFSRFEDSQKGLKNDKLIFSCKKNFSSGKSLDLHIETIFSNRKLFIKVKDIMFSSEFNEHNKELVILGNFTVSQKYISACYIEKISQFILRI